jgi:hypothetical protein
MKYYTNIKIVTFEGEFIRQCPRDASVEEVNAAIKEFTDSRNEEIARYREDLAEVEKSLDLSGRRRAYTDAFSAYSAHHNTGTPGMSIFGVKSPTRKNWERKLAELDEIKQDARIAHDIVDKKVRDWMDENPPAYPATYYEIAHHINTVFETSAYEIPVHIIIDLRNPQPTSNQ